MARENDDEPEDSDERPYHFQSNVGFDISINLAWCFSFAVTAALVTIGDPDIVDAIVSWLR